MLSTLVVILIIVVVIANLDDVIALVILGIMACVGLAMVAGGLLGLLVLFNYLLGWGL